MNAVIVYDAMEKLFKAILIFSTPLLNSAVLSPMTLVMRKSKSGRLAACWAAWCLEQIRTLSYI